jgi:hypothetical protein
MNCIKTRQVLRSGLEEAAVDNTSSFVSLSAQLLKIESARATYWKSASNPYSSEFAYDTTGQEEIVVWLLYFGFDEAGTTLVFFLRCHCSILELFQDARLCGRHVRGCVGRHV